MHRLLCVLLLTALLALPTATASGQGAMPAPDCHGQPVTDKADDNTSPTTMTKGNPSSDITGGFITFDGKKAQANVRVNELTAGEVDPGFVAISWEFAFSTKAGPRFVRAYQDLTGIVKYTWGEPRAITDDQTAPRVQGTTTGALFPGKDGIVQIDIPFAEMGAPAGTDLKSLTIQTRQWISLPAAVPTLPVPLFSPAPIFDDATGKGSVALNPCTATSTPAPGAPGGPPAPAPSEPGTGTPSGGPAPASLGVKVTVPKLSAKKLKKAKKFTIKLSGNASDLQAVVRKDAKGTGKALASGSLKTLKGTGRLTLKKAKLKKGTYVLTLTGKNAQGQDASGAVKIKVR